MERLCQIVIVALLSMSCRSSETENSSHVDQQRIYQDIESEYQGSSGTVIHRVQFTLGGATGTTLELVASSSVTVDTVPMVKQVSAVSGTSYFLERSATFNQELHQFVWTDTNKKTYTNSFEIIPADFSEQLPESISRTVGLTVTWKGAAIASAEDTVSLTLHNAASSMTKTINQSSAGATSIAFTALDLKDLTNSVYQLTIGRSTTMPKCSEFTAVGGICTSKYSTAPITMTLTD